VAAIESVPAKSRSCAGSRKREPRRGSIEVRAAGVRRGHINLLPDQTSHLATMCDRCALGESGSGCYSCTSWWISLIPRARGCFSSIPSSYS